MTTFRCSVGLCLLLLPMPVSAQEAGITARTPLEAIVLGDLQMAQSHLEGLAKTDWSARGAVVTDLLAAGFTPDRGLPGCEFYGYHRRTSEAGAARSVQIAMCKSGKSMVLVQDVLPPEKRGGGMSQLRERNDQ